MKKAARSKKERTAQEVHENKSSYLAAALHASDNKKPGGLFAIRFGSSGPRKRITGESIH